MTNTLSYIIQYYIMPAVRCTSCSPPSIKTCSGPATLGLYYFVERLYPGSRYIAVMSRRGTMQVPVLCDISGANYLTMPDNSNYASADESKEPDAGQQQIAPQPIWATVSYSIQKSSSAVDFSRAPTSGIDLMNGSSKNMYFSFLTSSATVDNSPHGCGQ